VSPPVFLLHGFTGTPRGWDAVRAAATGGHAFIALPLLGHAPGLCDGPERTFDDEVDRLASAIASRADGADVVGYSLGARVALGLAVRHPALVRRVVLVGVNPGVAGDVERRERAGADERWARLLETDGLAAFVDRWQALPLFATQRSLPADVLEAQRRERLTHDPRGLARSLRVTGLAQMPDYRERLPGLASRAHLVAGELDEKFRGIGERAAREASLPLAVIEGAGHNVPLERPGALARLLDEVLA
jgi:2-succinyl-6-hydroxy-2,4-cyclohexadiene-1-carboxylate synthase